MKIRSNIQEIDRSISLKALLHKEADDDMNITRMKKFHIRITAISQEITNLEVEHVERKYEERVRLLEMLTNPTEIEEDNSDWKPV